MKTARARPRPSLARARLRAVLARLPLDRRGATAVEFALVITPFLFILFSILEISIIFLVSLTLEDATARAARTIRLASASPATGISSHTSVNAFRTAVCDNMGWLKTQCAGYSDTTGLVIDVRNPASFTNGSSTSVIGGGVLAQYNGGECFYSGQAGGDIVIVRSYYPWQLMIPYLNLAFPKLKNGQIVLSDTEVFKLEPNQNSDTTQATSAAGTQGC